MNITIIGCGYVGLVSGTCFSEFGADVSCYDIDKDRIEKLSNGEIPIYEPGLDNLVKKNIKQGRLKFTSQIDNCVPESDIIFIAVGTPTRRGDGHADLQYVFKAIEDIAPYLNGYTLIVNKSTVPVGTAREVKKLIIEKNPKATFDVASNPEFLREGAAITDFMRPDRVVIGVESERASDLLRELYRPINLIEAPILFTNLESAELIKYASNAACYYKFELKVDDYLFQKMELRPKCFHCYLFLVDELPYNYQRHLDQKFQIIHLMYQMGMRKIAYIQF